MRMCRSKQATVRDLQDAAQAAEGQSLRIVYGAVGEFTQMYPQFAACYLVGIRTGAPLSFTKNTMNFAGLVLLALRPTTWTSFGPS